MGRSVTYRPKKERAVSSSEQACYMNIAKHIHEEDIDAQACAERIDRALEQLRLLDMEDPSMYDGISPKHTCEPEVDADVIHSSSCAPVSIPKEESESKCQQPCESLSPLAEVPSPVRNSFKVQAAATAQADPAHPGKVRSRNFLKADGEGSQTDGVESPLDQRCSIEYRSLGSAQELKQVFERRESLCKTLELTPCKQLKRISLGQNSAGRPSLGNDSPAMEPDASAFSPAAESDYRPPSLGSTSRLAQFFEREVQRCDKIDGRSPESRPKRQLSDLLKDDLNRLRQE